MGPLAVSPPDPNDTAACERAHAQIRLLREAFRDTILICPLSPDVCTVVYHRSVTDINGKLRKILSPNPVFVINSMMIRGAVKNVYSNIPLKDYIESIRYGKGNGHGHDVNTVSDQGHATADVCVPAFQGSMLLEIRFDRMEHEIADELGGILQRFHRMEDIQMTEPNGMSVTVHRFDSEDGSVHVMASVRHVAVTTDFYDQMRFKKLTKAVIEEFIRVFGVDELVRIGFRACFVMKPSALLNRGPLDMFTPTYADVFRAPSSTSHLGRVIREFHVQAQIMNRVVLSTSTLPDTEIGATVDVDSFIEKTVPTDAWWQSAEMLFDSNINTLRGAIPRELHRKLGIRE